MIWPAVAVMAFTGCHSGAGSHAGHDHQAEGHGPVSENTDVREDRDHIVFTRAQAEAAGLVVETVELSPFRQIIRASGQIRIPPGEEAVVAATSSGIVSFADPSFAEGAAIRQGQLLATISARDVVDGDPAARARIEYEAAGREYRRAEELVKDQIISQRDFDEARRRYETARAAFPAGSSAAGVRVTAPIGGFLRNRLVGQGEYVSVGQPMATISRSGRLQLCAEVSERYFAELSSIAGANFRLPHDQTVYTADKLLSYGRAVEGFYVPVFFEFANVGGILPGAFVEVWLLGRPVENAVCVPRSALTEEQGLFFVYLHHGGEDYARQEVAIGPDDGERVQILNGLKPGDNVVTRGATQVRLAALSGIVPEGHSH